MIALEQAGQHLEILGPAQAVEVIDNNPDATASEQLAYPAMLEQLLWGEVEAHGERYLSISQDGPLSLPAHPRAVRLRFPAFRLRTPDRGTGRSGLPKGTLTESKCLTVARTGCT